MSDTAMNDIPASTAAPESPGVPTGPGQQLAARREELNWSVEEVASHLNLAPRQVRAIEANDFSVLPVMAITRGFIRSYAKLLGLDAAPLLATISSANAPAAPEIAPRARVA
ncbi:MAG: helix-turn-helix domain-containing protein, partial [Noviherbaspirillum sp.]